MRCSTAILARGPLRAPVASPRQWARLGIEPDQSQQSLRRLTTRKGDFALPAPIEQRAFLPFCNPDHWERRTPWNPDQPYAAWIPSRLAAEPQSWGLSPPPEPSAQGLETDLSTCTVPCPTIGWLIAEGAAGLRCRIALIAQSFEQFQQSLALFPMLAWIFRDQLLQIHELPPHRR